MAVFRVNKNTNYTCMSNVHLMDRRLSLKAIGLLCRILSLPDDWDYSINGLVAICKEEQRAVTAALNELKRNGYLIIRKTPPTKGNNKFGYVYDIYETPQNVDVQNVAIQNVELQVVRLQDEGIQNVGANKVLTQSNTKESSTDGVNTKAHKAQSAVDVLIDSYTEDAELKEALREYRESRKALKKPLTEGALKRCLSTLDKLAGSTSEKIAIVNQSIERGWVGLFQIDKRGGNYGRGNAQYRGNPTGNDKPISAGKWDTVL